MKNDLHAILGGGGGGYNLAIFNNVVSLEESSRKGASTSRITQYPNFDHSAKFHACTAKGAIHFKNLLHYNTLIYPFSSLF